MKGYVLIPTINGTFREQYITCDAASWNLAVISSGHAAADYLKEHIIKKVRASLMVDSTGRIRAIVSQIGHRAKDHVSRWYAVALDPQSTPQDIRAAEKVLRHSVRYWTVIFPRAQKDLCEELYVQYLKSLIPYKGITEGLPVAPAKVCVACADYAVSRLHVGPPSYELCDACRENPMFQERARKHLSSFFLPWNQGGC